MLYLLGNRYICKYTYFNVKNNYLIFLGVVKMISSQKGHEKSRKRGI